jgi:hypothetical protein
MLYLSFIVVTVNKTNASGGGGGGGGIRPLAEEIIPVELRVRGVGKTEIDIIYRDRKAYLPLVQMFSFIKIKIEYKPEQTLVTGYFLHPDSVLIVDGAKGTITIGERTVPFGYADYFVTEKDIFLLESVYHSIFGLDFTYNPKKVYVKLTTKLRLPAIVINERERRLQRQRMAIQVPEASVTLGRKRLLAGLGRADWRFSSNVVRGRKPAGSYYTRLGGQLLMGDFQIQSRQTTASTFDKEKIRGFQRYTFLDNPYLQQVILGDIAVTGISPLGVQGIELTNRPAARRILFTREQFYMSTGVSRDIDIYTGTGFQLAGRSSAEGLFSTDLQLLYGFNSVNVFSVDEWGQETSQLYRIVVPQTILPEGTAQYSLIAGKIRGLSYHGYSNASLGYGVNSNFTVQGSIEYYNVPHFTRKVFPVLSAVSRLSQGLIGEAIVAPYANSQAKLSLTLPTLAGGSITYSRYGRNDFFNPQRIKDEIELSVSLPFSVRGSYLSFGSSARQTNFQLARERSLFAALSGQLYNIQPGISTVYTELTASGNAVVYKRWHTSPSFSARMPANFIFRLFAQYDHLERAINSVGLTFGRNFENKFYFQFYLDRVFNVPSSTIGFRLAYYFPFGRIQGVVSPSPPFSYRQTVSGSTLFSSTTGDIYFQNYPNRVGYGAFVVEPFLDIDNNGTLDEGDVPVTQFRMRATTQSTFKRLTKLNGEQFGTLSALPYQNYTIFIEPQKLDNPLWVMPYLSWDIVSEPNQVRTISLPIVVGGIVRGVVQKQEGSGAMPISNVVLHIKNIITGFEKTTETFVSGEYEFIGIPPGKYIIYIDDASLRSLGLRSEPQSQEVEIQSKTEGDFIENVDFVLQ